jgi:putative mRNA 3-end processing factor
MEVTVLGAARQVGRSAFLVKGTRTRVLLDFGVMMQREPQFPMHVRPKDVDGIILSHAHLDHSGATPLFFLGDGPAKLHCTGLTTEITRLLLEDFIKLSGLYLPFEYIDVLSMLKRTKSVNYREPIRVGEFEAQFLEAGHIPGGASVLLQDGGKRLLYTGDIDGKQSSLMRGADTSFDEVDFLITESTYALTDHPPRTEVEAEFVAWARAIVERGGTLLVPAFSVGRSQEIACVLQAHGFPHNVAMDGMALKTNDILLRHQEYLRDPVLFRRTLEHLQIVRSWDERKKLVHMPGVIISPAGMLVGGASVFYHAEVAKQARNGIAIVSFQVPGSPGRTLLDKGLAIIGGRPRKVSAEIHRFDFSAHSGRRELFTMLKGIKGSPKVVTIHGEADSCTQFAQQLRQDLGLEAFAPDAGESFRV